MGIIAGIILIAVIVYSMIALNRQKNKAKADKRGKKFKGRERNKAPESKNIGDSSEEEEKHFRK